MKKYVSLILIMLFAVLVSGCCLRHQWTEADCSPSQYCLNCGKESGYVIEHSWQEADCLQPRHCVACGLTEGGALGHSVEQGWCTRCGERLYSYTADFEMYGIGINMQPDTVYTFSTGTKKDPAAITTGEIRLSGFGLIPEDQAHPAREGYEWCYVMINATFYDEAARLNGVTVMADLEDYYNIALRGSTAHTDAEGMKVHSVMVNDQEMRVRYRRSGSWSGWQTGGSGRRENVYTSVWEIQRPQGYDGIVVGLHSSYVNWPEGQYIHQVYSPESFRLFRLG